MLVIHGGGWVVNGIGGAGQPRRGQPLAGAGLGDLMLAATRQAVYCVDSQAGPTDLRTIQNQLACDAVTGTLGQTWGGR